MRKNPLNRNLALEAFGPWRKPTKSSAIPPAAKRRSMRYLPNSSVLTSKLPLRYASSAEKLRLDQSVSRTREKDRQHENIDLLLLHSIFCERGRIVELQPAKCR